MFEFLRNLMPKDRFNKEAAQAIADGKVDFSRLPDEFELGKGNIERAKKSLDDAAAIKALIKKGGGAAFTDEYTRQREEAAKFVLGLVIE